MDTKIFDTLLEPVFVLNEKKEILYCNQPAGLICDLVPRKLIRSRTPFDQVFHFSTSLEHLQSLNQVVDSTSYQEVSFKTDSGKTGKVQITFQPFSELNQQKTWILFFRDVTLEETLQRKYRAELEQKENVIIDLKTAQAELEKYSKNLEQMVEERTAQIRKLNQMMGALLDSLGQGFFIFDQNGECLEIFSKACEQTVECQPFGKKIWDVLKLEEKQIKGFQKWMLTVFAEMLPFHDLTPLAPQEVSHSQGKQIQLEYYPLRANEQRAQQTGIEGVVVVATDITKLIQAQKEAEVERAHAKMIVSLISQKRLLASFMQESEALISELKQELWSPSSANFDNLFRILHTLKGGAASFSIKPLTDQTHHTESLLLAWNSEKSAPRFEQLKTASDKIENHFRDFLTENQGILGSIEKLKRRWIEIPADKLHQFQGKLPVQLKNEFMTTFLMEPVGDYFQHYDEIIRTIAEREMKEVGPLLFRNPTIPILPEPYSQLFSTFIHQFRNAIDHGIEIPTLRQELGKPTAGKIEMGFSLQEEDGIPWLLLEVQDDGSGIDPDRIRAKLSRQGQDCKDENDEQVIQHIFDSQFSTKEVVSETSGRGVGMDAIFHAAKNLGGTAWVRSQLGQGTHLFVKVPYQMSLKNPGQNPQDGNQAA